MNFLFDFLLFMFVLMLFYHFRRTCLPCGGQKHLLTLFRILLLVFSNLIGQ